ncbi:hypothetical protein DPMN_022847 [Dreissena polymorpha]|uniref:Uncharacterized protein n=1 Tax=Dreissena polymorpha TaxID=45954 RepID=A0A9D4NN53_DREPO|nr:hypothetical protein DPMN_022847 [Dreissena polymorpha]
MFIRDQARCASADTDEHPSCNSNKKEPQTKSLSEMQMYYAKQNSLADKYEKFYVPDPLLVPAHQPQIMKNSTGNDDAADLGRLHSNLL